MTWKLWVDTGGTFTDCLATTPDGELKRIKILSSSVLRATVESRPSSTSLQVKLEWPVDEDIFQGYSVVFPNGTQRKVVRVDLQKSVIHLNAPVTGKKVSYIEITSREEVPVLAARLLTGTPLNGKFPDIELKLGSTRGTNALLERKGAATALVVTKGFRDLLEIGTQQRPDLFALNIIKRTALYKAVIEADERVEADGSILRHLRKEEITRIFRELKRKKIQAVAIAFLHSYKNPVHERMLGEALRNENIDHVSVSHELSPQIKILPRAETAVVNAYLHPVIHSYVSKITHALKAKNFHIMSSAGGLLKASDFQPKDSLLSGPAGGILGAIEKAKQSHTPNIISFDMGGTSTDVSLSQGRPQYQFACEVGDQKILSPAIAIETIAAGGGSICDFDQYKLTVGPHSAGASPGPACYGAGGPLTITDVNLLLGRLSEKNFSIPVHRKDAEKALKNLIQKIQRYTKKSYSSETVLTSLLQIANEKMAEAIRKVSIQQGHDPRDYALLCFGGAGGQHACSLSAILGIKKVIMPYDAGLLSAWGIGQAQVERMPESLVLSSLDEFYDNYEIQFNKLYAQAVDELTTEGHQPSRIQEADRFAFVRLKGQETSLEIDASDKKKLFSAFKAHYKKVYGHWIDDRIVEVESIRMRVVVMDSKSVDKRVRLKRHKPIPESQAQIFSETKFRRSNVYRWEKLSPGAVCDGPALVLSNHATLWVESGWQFFLDEHNTAVLVHKSEVGKKLTVSKSQEAELELFTNRFTAIAQHMGALLQRTAFSVNVKERLDFSCALLDANGSLIVNAPHIPVHLGSLGVCVRAVKKSLIMHEGDVVITNHPAYGGSHLPDITLMKPVFFKKKLVGYVVNRAHHAEVGGKKPGSMPADAVCLEEEGVVIAPTFLMKRGKVQWKAVERIFTDYPYPTRALQENIADLNAALAAATLGETELIKLCSQFGMNEVQRYMRLLKRQAAMLIQQKIGILAKRKLKATEFLDDGSKLCVSIFRDKKKLTIDFTGSAGMHAGNLNATPAIVTSVVLYVIRLLLNKPVPLNEGLLESVKIILPTGILNPKFQSNAKKSPAVVGGNTEVSQRLTDLLLKVFGMAACSQGTMNNFLFGDDQFGYYETICGGTGAGNGFHGADAVHQHMTNTRITDPEIMEWRYPVRVERFEIRKGSGGKGKWKGGDGVIREIYFKKPMDMNVLTQHRIQSPYGMQGGASGKTGSQHLIKANSKKIKLHPIDGARVEAGDRIVIKTPGGGALGKL